MLEIFDAEYIDCLIGQTVTFSRDGEEPTVGILGKRVQVFMDWAYPVFIEPETFEQITLTNLDDGLYVSSVTN